MDAMGTASHQQTATPTGWNTRCWACSGASHSMPMRCISGYGAANCWGISGN